MTSIAEQVGRVVGGRYRLLAPVGAGASSHVYAALDTRLGRRVAVKLLHPTLAVDATFLRRFQAEARLAASLDHPHIMRVFDWGEEAAGPYLVLEYLGGGSLRGLLDTGVLLTHSQAASVGSQASAGLAYAHRRGIAHRDIKPGNLLFDDEGHLRIGDFGVARALAESALTEPLGAMFGTARYASPEHAEGRHLDDRTDVYSLALVLYESLTGHVPFARETIAGTLMARVGASMPPAHELGPLAPILAQAAISEPLARLDAASLAADLELLARELPPPAPIPLDRIETRQTGTRWSERDPTNLQRVDPLDDLTLVGFSSEPPPPPPPPPPGMARGATGALIAGDAGAGGVTAQAGAATSAGFTGGTAVAAPPLPPGPDNQQDRATAMGSSAPSQPGNRTSSRTGRRRWWKWLLALVALVVAAGAGTFAFMRYDLYNHVVPNLEGKALGAAEQSAHHAGLVLRTTITRYDAAVPAGRVIWQSIGPGRHERRSTVIDVSVSRGAHPVPVPDLAAKTITAAAAGLRAAHLVPGPVRYQHTMAVRQGLVISWSAEGRAVVPGSKIGLVVSAGPPLEKFTNLNRLPYSEAAASLQRLHLKAIPKYQFSHVSRGAVISTRPRAGQTVREGSAVIVKVSLGPPMTTVPTLIGRSVSGAEQILASHHLHVVTIYGPSVGIVIYSSPPPGDRVEQGTGVSLWVA